MGDMGELVAEVADAIARADIGFTIELTALVDGVREYTLTIKDGSAPITFGEYHEASEYVEKFRREAKARAAIDVMRRASSSKVGDAP